jgi:5'(3')-deoxyribonucleotidase
MKKIFVDIDGVLADFNSKWVELFGSEPKETFNRHSWQEFVASRQFEKLDMLPDAYRLIDYLVIISSKPAVSVHLLGSTGGYEYHGTVQEQKLKWLEKHHILFDAVLVPGKRYKQWHATESAILIDDHEKNVEQFISRGGNAILHTSANDTIAKLKNIGL